MKLMLIAASVVILAQSSIVVSAQLFSGHKSESEVAKMTAEQHVEEYCREYVRHGVWHDYKELLSSYISRDGLRAVPALTRILGEYDPTTPARRTKERRLRFDTASVLLGNIDETVVRLRGSEIGRASILALKSAVERMQVAGFYTKKDLEYEKQVRYEQAVALLERMEGLNFGDDAIRDTLRIRLKIRLTDEELRDFVSYLISRDPNYPTRIKAHLYKDFNDLNEAGNPRQYRVVVDIEPFYKAYREYKAKTK